MLSWEGPPRQDDLAQGAPTCQWPAAIGCCARSLLLLCPEIALLDTSGPSQKGFVQLDRLFYGAKDGSKNFGSLEHRWPRGFDWPMLSRNPPSPLGKRGNRTTNGAQYRPAADVLPLDTSPLDD